MSLKFFCAALAIGAAAFAPASAKDRVSPAVAAYNLLTKAPESDWRTIEPENLLVLDLPSGPVAIELRADFAPAHVERIRSLVRSGFYNGLTFHRVVEGFVAQGGDPKGDGTGGSELPDLPPEFARDVKDVNGFREIGRDRIASRVGFVDGMPVAAQPDALRTFLNARSAELWGVHCPGILSMARATDPASANSQFFILLGDARLDLDSRYSVWGLVLDGIEHTRRIARGEPPTRPTSIVRARIGADIPVEKRPKVEILKTDTATFVDYIKAARLVTDDGFVKDLCDIRAPRKINGTIEP